MVCQRLNFKALSAGHWPELLVRLLCVPFDCIYWFWWFSFFWCGKRLIVENLNVLQFVEPSILYQFGFLPKLFIARIVQKHRKLLTSCKTKICQILQYITRFKKQLTCEPGLMNHFIHNVFSLFIQIIDAVFEVPKVHRSICNFNDIVNYF